MNKHEITIPTNVDEIELSLAIFEVENPKAIIQVVHGMCEHKERFERLAITLCNNGYSVVLSDLRGHGKSVSKDKKYGFFGKKNGHINLVNDQLLITNYIKSRYPANRIYIFAHSMGTIITRNYLQKHDNLIDKVVLSGAPCYQKGARIGVLVSSILSKFKNKPSKFLANITTGPFNKIIKNPSSDNDWISYNMDNVDAYNNNPLCGFYFTPSGYNTLYKLIIRMTKTDLYKVANQGLKIHFIAGVDDPCIGKEKGFNNSINTLKKVGYKNITSFLYENMRHEILNEKDNEFVYSDIVSFFDTEEQSD